MPARDERGLLDLIYGAAAEPALWPDVMNALADHIGGSSVFLSRLSVLNGTGEGIATRIDPASRTPYLQHFAAINVLNNVQDATGYMSGWTPSILLDEDWIPKEELVRSEYHNDFQRRLEIHSTMMIRLAAGGRETCVMNVHRPEPWGRFETRHLERAHSMHPHLIRAFGLTQKLEPILALVGELAAVLDESAHGLFVLDHRGVVRHVNRAGEALLARGVGLRVAGGRLTAVSCERARTLEGLIASAASADPTPSLGGAMALPFETGRAPLSITVTPFRGGQRPWPFASAAAVLVCVTDLEPEDRPQGEKLRLLFGLTPAEVRVALALYDGSTLKDAAGALGISPHTAHVHLSRVFGKTGTHRQSQLVALMVRAAGLRPD
ncbi:MAG TPA: LuxR C-terminal-related transcriptional regulator [Caulobacteraceae bacterium]|nr:LuxR C-terminal-related transcriptional regulator [Caulobacteraceae bacterium]